MGVSLKATLARPKSHILSLQSALAKIFFGFKSRWKTLAARKSGSCENKALISSSSSYLSRTSHTQNRELTDTYQYECILSLEGADTERTDNAPESNHHWL